MSLFMGLGFFDSMNAGSSTGSYGAASVPLIYDTFVENNQGQKLTDTTVFDNPSAALKNELTSGQLYFNGPLLSKFTSGGKAKLHAPSTFDAGSSISHLDETSTLKGKPADDTLCKTGVRQFMILENIHYPSWATLAG